MWVAIAGTQDPASSSGSGLLGSTYIAREELSVAPNLQQTLTLSPPPQLTTQGEQVPATNKL